MECWEQPFKYSDQFGDVNSLHFLATTQPWQNFLEFAVEAFNNLLDAIFSKKCAAKLKTQSAR
jgi:hypothetical protein